MAASSLMKGLLAAGLLGLTVTGLRAQDFPSGNIVPLTTVWRSAQVLAVRPTLGLKSVAEFIAYAKANRNKVTIGSVRP